MAIVGVWADRIISLAQRIYESETATTVELISKFQEIASLAEEAAQDGESWLPDRRK